MTLMIAGRPACPKQPKDNLESEDDVDKLLDSNYAIILELIRLRHRLLHSIPFGSWIFSSAGITTVTLAV